MTWLRGTRTYLVGPLSIWSRAAVALETPRGHNLSTAWLRERERRSDARADDAAGGQLPCRASREARQTALSCSPAHAAALDRLLSRQPQPRYAAGAGLSGTGTSPTPSAIPGRPPCASRGFGGSGIILPGARNSSARAANISNGSFCR